MPLARRTLITAIVLVILTISVLVGLGGFRLTDKHLLQRARQTRVALLSGVDTDGAAEPARNSTLGFGSVYVLSDDPTSWRLQGLRKAAELVGLRLTVPILKPLPDDQVQAAVAAGDPAFVNGAGGVRASLNHAALLREFLHSGYDTALVLEDDADFDINIGKQVVALSRALQRDADERSQTCTTSTQSYCHDSWDILWLGHCGLEFTPMTSVLHYEDTSALDWDHLTNTFNSYYKNQRGGDGRQQIVRAIAPLCTYAYAITRQAAQTVVDEFPELPMNFDLELHRACKGGHQRCVAPVPELFHHHKAAGEQSIGIEGDLARQDLDWYRGRHKYTYNVQWSARCNVMKVGERLAEGWQCMPGKYDHVV